MLLPGATAGASLRADVEAVLATYEADQKAYQERVAAAVERHATGTPGLREAYVNPEADQVIFVGDEWTHELATDVVGGLLDAIGEELEPGSFLLVRGGLSLSSSGLETYRRVPLG